MDKYLSVITNFGCHGRCPYCIVRENGIKVPKSTVDGLDKLEDAITLTGANIVSISGGGDPLYRYSDNPLVPMYAETVRWQYVRFHIRQFKGQWKIHGKQKETHNQRNETEVG